MSQEIFADPTYQDFKTLKRTGLFILLLIVHAVVTTINVNLGIGDTEQVKSTFGLPLAESMIRLVV
jgi:hypothetical protein